MSKKQTGFRIDRVLYERFQKLCATEKLRPGEALEQLVRLAVETGGVAEVYMKAARPGRTGQAIDEVLFGSQLSRLKATLVYERTFLERGEAVEDNDRQSDQIIEKLAEIGRRAVSEELIKEFQKVITDADKLYEESEKQSAEEMISKRKPSAVSVTREVMPSDSPREVPSS